MVRTGIAIATLALLASGAAQAAGDAARGRRKLPRQAHSLIVVTC